MASIRDISVSLTIIHWQQKPPGAKDQVPPCALVGNVYVNVQKRVGDKYMCNELGKGRPRLETGSTDDGLSGFSKNRHNPVMVYNDLMIRNITVHNYNKDRSQPVTIQCLYTWVGAPVDRRR